MSAERVTFDANVLFYSVDRNAGERHEHAIDLLERVARGGNGILMLQALAEFFAATTRKLGMPYADAAAQVEDWQVLFPVAAATSASLRRAMAAKAIHGLSFWDAMLWATSREAGVTLLLSEDFQDGRELDGVRFRNPFVARDVLA